MNLIKKLYWMTRYARDEAGVWAATEWVAAIYGAAYTNDRDYQLACMAAVTPEAKQIVRKHISQMPLFCWTPERLKYVLEMKNSLQKEITEYLQKECASYL